MTLKNAQIDSDFARWQALPRSKLPCCLSQFPSFTASIDEKLGIVFLSPDKRESIFMSILVIVAHPTLHRSRINFTWLAWPRQ